MRHLILLPLLQVLLLAATAQTDRQGCEDYPLVTRYPGSAIGWCDEQTFHEYHIATGPLTGYRKIDAWVDVSGRVNRRYYTLQGTRTVTEVYRNYLQAVQQGGFEVLAQGLHADRGGTNEVGGRTWLGTAYAANPLPSSEGIDLFHGTSTSGGTGYFAARSVVAAQTVYVVLMAYQHTQSEVLVMLDIIEASNMEGGLVEVDAAYMGQAIDRQGKVALYGLYFDTDQATLKAASQPALDEIAALLRARPQQHLYVVGHTDFQGTLAYNLDLSLRRAQAVIAALVDTQGIDARRLTAQGVGPLVPVATNRSDPGRAQNRRVELVDRTD